MEHQMFPGLDCLACVFGRVEMTILLIWWEYPNTLGKNLIKGNFTFLSVSKNIVINF